MKVVTIKGHVIKLYDSIDELPIVNFQKYNKCILIDSGLGSDVDSVDSHIVNIARFINSGDKKQAMLELQEQHRQIINGERPTIERFAHQLAYNVIPHIDLFTDNGYTKEELKMYNETRKIMHSDIRVSATCVRVPTLRAHSEAVWCELEHPLSLETIRDAIAHAPGCELVDPYPMPLDRSGLDDVAVGRIRKDLTDDSAFTFFCVGDQIRKGAALNAIQIAEYLIQQ